MKKILTFLTAVAFFLSNIIGVFPFESCSSVAFGQIQISYKEEVVMFNVQTGKYHDPSCRWALRCTKNCIAISRSEAIARGGVPCKVCGG